MRSDGKRAMEKNEQYALYDGADTSGGRWVAHVRLTPELLQRLQHDPASVTIQFHSAASTARPQRGSAAAKPVSVLTVQDEADAEPSQYELLSFTEDPTINQVCAFRPEQDDQVDGYSLYEVGRVHQKLIVQRMLDSTEKDRMKDRHAKSVLESKARSSKLLETPASRTSKRTTSVMSLSTSAATKPAQETRSSPRKRRIRSALTAERAKEIQELISRPTQEEQDTAEDEDTSATESKASVEPRVRLFSSESEAEAKAPLQNPKAATARKSTKKKTEIPEPVILTTAEAASPKRKKQKTVDRRLMVSDGPTVSSPQTLQSNPLSSSLLSPRAFTEALSISEPVPEAHSSVASEEKAHISAIIASSSLSKSSTAAGGENKRARPRHQALPELSFLPEAIQQICKRLSTYITRTAIRDDTDHDFFINEYDRLWNEWEELDKAYSIQIILSEGLHLRKEFAVDQETKERFDQEIREAEKKREGLLFIRNSMATIKKILASLQVSIAAYEQRKTPTLDTTGAT
ncbi:hypothetical protein Poli38472_012113 [Pythium oligandrum]|uniref:Uncharacterized protein n=1 Tax=Pythium oligandrum TaxID=41045 RepID=A0A8K1CNV1_PYTOL|nr:hypothetical protein Poli38472_012113 [Pythium oligandrum]|eukprot:TMW66997.1 hypothetical protein Poli38472_012113 [Pythium oligandrum]